MHSRVSRERASYYLAPLSAHSASMQSATIAPALSYTHVVDRLLALARLCVARVWVLCVRLHVLSRNYITRPTFIPIFIRFPFFFPRFVAASPLFVLCRRFIHPRPYPIHRSPLNAACANVFLPVGIDSCMRQLCRLTARALGENEFRAATLAAATAARTCVAIGHVSLVPRAFIQFLLLRCIRV